MDIVITITRLHRVKQNTNPLETEGFDVNETYLQVTRKHFFIIF